jgi:hypothetical protein
MVQIDLQQLLKRRLESLLCKPRVAPRLRQAIVEFNPAQAEQI